MNWAVQCCRDVDVIDDDDDDDDDDNDDVDECASTAAAGGGGAVLVAVGNKSSLSMTRLSTPQCLHTTCRYIDLLWSVISRLLATLLAQKYSDVRLTHWSGSVISKNDFALGH